MCLALYEPIATDITRSLRSTTKRQREARSEVGQMPKCHKGGIRIDPAAYLCSRATIYESL